MYGVFDFDQIMGNSFTLAIAVPGWFALIVVAPFLIRREDCEINSDSENPKSSGARTI